MPPLLTLDALSVSLLNDRHDRVPVLIDVSLTLARGEMVALVGESGSGKTTLGMSLLRLLPRGAKISGRVLLQQESGAIDLLTLSARAMRRHRGPSLAMIFQEPGSALDPRMRVGDQVSGCLRIHQKLSRQAARQAAVEMLHRVGLPEPEKRARDYPHQLSGGMRQRVATAMALVHQPAVLIADEPTTALDLRLQQQNLQLLRDETDRQGRAVLLITHDLRLASQWCDRIAVLYAGRLVEVGGRGEVAARPRHPYTRALLALSPNLAQPPGRLPVLAGAMATASQFLEGCGFAPRCPLRQDSCTAAVPGWSENAEGHGVRCFYPDGAAAATAGGRA